MKRNDYITPVTTVMTVTPTARLMAGSYRSAGNTPADDPIVGGIDNSDDDNRSRINHYNCWDDEEEE